MNWDAIGAIGELTAALATVLTLAYLATQIRHSTKAARASGYQAAVTSVSEWTREIGADPTLAILIERGARDPSQLDEAQRAQFSFLATSIVRNFENFHYQYVNGYLEAEDWTAWKVRIVGTLSTPGFRSWWTEQREAFSTRFRGFLDEALEETVADSDHPLQPLGSDWQVGKLSTTSEAPAPAPPDSKG